MRTEKGRLHARASDQVVSRLDVAWIFAGRVDSPLSSLAHCAASWCGPAGLCAVRLGARAFLGEAVVTNPRASYVGLHSLHNCRNPRERRVLQVGCRLAAIRIPSVYGFHIERSRAPERFSLTYLVIPKKIC